MNKKWQAPLRRTLALLLCVASLLGMFPTVLRQEANAESESYRDRTTAVNGAVTVDGKQVAYMGETVYTIGQSASVTSALTTVSSGITVFEPNNNDNVVPYDPNVDPLTGLGDSGHYTLQVPEGLDTTIGGRYEVNVIYNGSSTSAVIGTVTLLIPSPDSKILSMTGLRDHVTAKDHPKTTKTSRFSLQLIETNHSIPRGTLFAIRSATGYMMSYDPLRSSAAENTGSFEFESNGNSLGTIYNVDDTYYMDHSLRNDALWFMSQYYSHSNVQVPGFFKYSMDFTTTTTSLSNYTPLFSNGQICISTTIQKGKQAEDTYSFWYNNGEASNSTNPVFRHLNVRSTSAPFCNNNTMFGSNGHADTKGEACQYILEKVPGNQFIFYFRSSDTDIRVLGCDATGNWYVKQYNTYGNKADTVSAIWGNTEHRLNLYKYVRETGSTAMKKVAYKGYTVYDVAKNISLADLKTAIYSNLTVFDTERRNQYVPGENDLKGNGQDKAGYYWLKFPSNFSTSTTGTKTVQIMYNSLVNDTGAIVSEEIGTVTVNIQDVTYSVGTNKEVVASLNAGASRQVYSADSSGNAIADNTAYITVTAGSQTIQVPITVGMLSPAVDTSTPGVYRNLTLTYMDQNLGSGYVLHVHDTTLTQDRPVYPKPGSVMVSKKETTDQDAFFENSEGDGVANIQLSAKGKNTVLGVDLVIIMDLSNSMTYSLNSNNYATETAADPSRMTVLKQSLNALISKMKSDNLDVRIALADFGDLDHYEFENAVIDKSHRAWPHLEMAYGQGGEEYAEEATDSKFYAVNYNNEIANQLNFVLGKGDKTAATDNNISGTSNVSQPFYLHPYKYDSNMSKGFTGKILPHVYTGSGSINADAFVKVNTLNNATMAGIEKKITERMDNLLGTNYDVGLEYAYRLAYARQQKNLEQRENRVVSCIFMSDGAAMQYNYFSGRSQSESWSKYLTGDTDEIVSNYSSAAKWDINNLSTLHPDLYWTINRMWELLHKGQLWVASHDGESPNAANNGQIGTHYNRKWGTQYAYGTKANDPCTCGADGNGKLVDFVGSFKGHTGQYVIKDMYDILELIYDNRGNTSLTNNNPFGSSYTGDAFWTELVKRLREPSYKSGSSGDRWQYQTYSPYWYFYNTEGKNWWAEAIKGKTDQIYPVINRHIGKTAAEAEGGQWKGDLYQGVSITSSNNQNVPADMKETNGTGKPYISGFPGLGIEVYTIALAITADDNMISKTETEKVLKTIASTPAMCYSANNATALTNAFNEILSKAATAASGAYLTDTMGEQYDLLTSALTTTKNKLKGYTPTITLNEYKVDANGNRCDLVKTWEKITFGADGVAYLNGGTEDIWNDDGGIRGEYIYYNTKSSGTVTLTNIRDTGRDFTLQPETIFWSIGTIGDTEMVLEYQVYLNGSTEGTLPNKQTYYPTNKEAIFHYKDELGNMIDLPTVSPKYYWYETPSTAYQFYLVNSSGQPVNSSFSTSGVTVADAHKIGKTVTVDINVTTDNTTELVAKNLLSAAGVDTNKYELYSPDTRVDITSDVNVQSHNVDITDAPSKKTTYMGSGTADLNGVYNAALLPGVYFAVKLKNSTKPDTVVVDYGLPVDINVLGNDGLKSGSLYGYANTTTVPEATLTTPSGYTLAPSTLSLTYGSAKGNSNNVRWTPSNMQMNGYEKFVYCVTDSNIYYFNTVTVIPATSIYYEDNFVKFETNTSDPMEDTVWSWATWTNEESDGTDIDTPIGTPITGTQNNNATGNGIYGYDSAYAGTTTYSGEAYKATVLDKTPARATFTFTGTGFDVISKTSSTTGAITVNVYAGNVTTFDDPSTEPLTTDKNGNFTYDESKFEGPYPDKTFLVETYYSLGDIYQVPVIKCENLNYGTYTVEILVAYNEWFATEHPDGQFDFYLDAIRIYNPAGINPSGVIGTQYAADHESWPRYRELRNMILDPLDLENQTDDLSGMLFIDTSEIEADEKGNKKFTYSKYASWGPNNELYLNMGKAIVFTLDVEDYKAAAFDTVDGQTVKIHLAMRGLGGTTKVKINDNEVDISATDMYYDITDYADETVKIEAASDVAVSITNIKVTHSEEPKNYTVNTTVQKSATVTQTGNLLNTDPKSLNALITVNADMAAEVLDQLNKDLAAPAVITPKYASLSFKDLIHTNIYFTADKLSGIDAANLGLAVFADHAVDGTVDTASYVVNGAALVDGMYKVSTQGIPAKNLGDTIYFKVFAKEADGTYTYSNLLTYSPLEYANFLIESGSDMDKTLAAAMLNYGAEAQKYFGYKADSLMNADVTAEAQALLNSYSISDLDAMDAIDETKVGAFAATEGFTKKYPSVTFKGAFQINYYFEPAAQVDGDMTFYYWTEDTCNAVTELTAENADGTAVMTAENGVYTAISGPIFAKNLDSTVYVAAVYESNGQTCCTGILPYSVAEYARAFADGTDDFAPFAKAVGTYGSVAKAYFGN